MTDTPDIAESEAPRIDPDALRDADDHLNPLWVERLRAKLHEDDIDGVAKLTDPLHAADMGDLLEALDAEERVRLVTILGDKFDFSALTEVDDSVRTELIEDLPSADVARGVAELDSDDAVHILEDIDVPERDEILAQMPAFERLSLKRSLDFPEDSAGRLMQTDFIAIPPYWTVGQTIDYLRTERELPDEFYQIYVVDAAYNLQGIIPLDKFLRAKREMRIGDLMQTNVIEVPATEDQEEAARDFERYDLVEVAVVDESRRLVGVLTIDDIVDVIHEEATEDMQLLAGVGDEEISDSIVSTVKGRATWLVVNLLTALMASFVIGLFDATIEEMVALAALMPMVASMGGNAATQTMTVTVRALAMHELDSFKIRRLVIREMTVGVLNGLIFALLIGLMTWLRFFNLGLGIVIGLAMIVNMIAAGSAGVLVPLALNKYKIDPAVASSVFVTTVTDVVGFFGFLGLAAIWMAVLGGGA